VFPAAAVPNEDVKSEGHATYDAADTDVGGTDEITAEAIAPSLPSDCQPMPDKISLHNSVDVRGDVLSVDGEGVSASCGTLSSAAIEKIDADGSADDRRPDLLCTDSDARAPPSDSTICSDDAVTAEKVAITDAAADAVLVTPADIISSEDSHQSGVDTVSQDVTSQMHVSSTISCTDSATSVISSLTTISCPPVACETPASLDLRPSAAGICCFIVYCSCIEGCDDYDDDDDDYDDDDVFTAYCLYFRQLQTALMLYPHGSWRTLCC